jgi:hypothetical protein
MLGRKHSQEPQDVFVPAHRRDISRRRHRHAHPAAASGYPPYEGDLTIKESRADHKWPFGLYDSDDHLIDTYRTRSAIDHAVRELNAGRALVNPHRPLGCRVQPITNRTIRRSPARRLGSLS